LLHREAAECRPFDRYCAAAAVAVSTTMTSPFKPHNTASRAIIIGTTVVLGGAAVALIFAPAEVARSIGITEPGASIILLQLYGAALFGLAMTGWMVKDAIVGGVFGRSYVVGNAGHSFVGALALIRPALEPTATPALRVLACVYVALAIIFGYLMFVAAPRS
jgi:hypothetical protein